MDEFQPLEINSYFGLNSKTSKAKLLPGFSSDPDTFHDIDLSTPGMARTRGGSLTVKDMGYDIKRIHDWYVPAVDNHYIVTNGGTKVSVVNQSFVNLGEDLGFTDGYVFDFLNYGDSLYYGNGVDTNRIARINQSLGDPSYGLPEFRNWGIVAPATKPTCALTAGTMDGVYQYVYTYVNTASGHESSASPESDAVSPSTQGVIVTVKTSLDPQVDKINIYRTTDQGANYFYVTQIDNDNGSSLVLDGTDDYITVPDNAAFDFGSGDFTLKCRFNLSVIGGLYEVMGKWNPFANQASWALTLRTDTNKVQFSYSADGTAATVVGFTYSAWAINTWHDLEFCRSGNFIYCFIDGVALTCESSNAFSVTLFDSTAPVYIGARQSSAASAVVARFLNGYIDELVISKGIARHTSNFSLSQVATVSDSYTSLLMHFDDVNNSVTTPGMADSSPNGFTVTPVNHAKISTAEWALPNATLQYDLTYTDDADDTALGTTEAPLYNDPPPVPFLAAEEWDGVIWGFTVDSTIIYFSNTEYYSVNGNPEESFHPDNFINLRAKVFGIRKSPNFNELWVHTSKGIFGIVPTFIDADPYRAVPRNTTMYSGTPYAIVNIYNQQWFVTEDWRVISIDSAGNISYESFYIEPEMNGSNKTKIGICQGCQYRGGNKNQFRFIFPDSGQVVPDIMIAANYLQRTPADETGVGHPVWEYHNITANAMGVVKDATGNDILYTGNGHDLIKQDYGTNDDGVAIDWSFELGWFRGNPDDSRTMIPRWIVQYFNPLGNWAFSLTTSFDFGLGGGSYQVRLDPVGGRWDIDFTWDVSRWAFTAPLQRVPTDLGGVFSHAQFTWSGNGLDQTFEMHSVTLLMHQIEGFRGLTQ